MPLSSDFGLVWCFICFEYWHFLGLLLIFSGQNANLLNLTFLAMSTDPVQQIKDEESKTSQKIEELTKKNHQNLDNHRIKKERELEEYKDDLRKKGQESLEKAKQDAMGEFKKITEDEDRSRSSLISSATSKKDEAVKYITQAFEKNLS